MDLARQWERAALRSAPQVSNLIPGPPISAPTPLLPRSPTTAAAWTKWGEAQQMASIGPWVRQVGSEGELAPVVVTALESAPCGRHPSHADRASALAVGLYMSRGIRHAWLWLMFATFCGWRSVVSHESWPYQQPHRDALLWFANLFWPKAESPAGLAMVPPFAPGYTEERLGLLFAVWGAASMIMALYAGLQARRVDASRREFAALAAVTAVAGTALGRQLWIQYWTLA